MNTTTKALFIALGSLCLTAPAALADNEFGFEFEFDRNELATETGANSVYTDLLAEVETRCEHSNVSDTLSAKKLERICVDETMDTAIAELNDEELETIHSGEG